jgi:hypothetical protein
LSKISLGSIENGYVDYSSSVSIVGKTNNSITISGSAWRGIISDYIKIKENTSYFIGGYTNFGGNAVVFCDFYDTNKNWLSAVGKLSVGFNKIKNEYNASYVRISIVANSDYTNFTINNIQFEQSSTATEYEAYIERKIYVDGEEFLNAEKQDTNNQQNYSTSEQVIGTWVDGKPLYRKVLYGSSTGGDLRIATPPEIETMARYEIYRGDNKVELAKIPSTLHASGKSNCKIDCYWMKNGWVQNTLYIASDETGLLTNIVAIIEYTKTTD